MEDLKKKYNRRTLVILTLIVVGMFAFGYAMVPLYNVLCSAIGLNGKTGGATEVASTVDNSREVTIEFLATANANLPWSFYPRVKKIKVHPGENRQIDYYAKNNASKTMTVQAIPSVTPGIAAKYLKKTECFCFTQQTFKAGEAREMPILFHIDKDLPKDIHTVTLSYTMFDIAQLSKPVKRESGRIQ